MKVIPMSADVAAVIGDGASKLSNHSLLLDKFVAPKKWPGLPKKIDEANRWSMLRLTRDGTSAIQKGLEKAKRDFQKKAGDATKASESAEAAIKALPEFLHTAPIPPSIRDLRVKHTRELARLVETSKKRSTVVCARLRSRLAINLSEGLVQNAGISLDRLTAAPLIPGTAIKGCARAFAIEELKSLQESDPTSLPERFQRFLEVFGYTEADFKSGFTKLHRFGSQPDDHEAAQGLVCFLPASPVSEYEFEIDLTNVHTPKYYQTGKLGDLREEDPRPNPFPTVAAGATFLFSLVLTARGNRNREADAILSDAKRWLVGALEVTGLGAKTGSGHGWFEVVDAPVVSELLASSSLQRTESSTSMSDAEFKAMLERACDAGQREKFLSSDLPVLKQPEYRQRLAQFVQEIENRGGKSIKKMREKDWFLELKKEAQK